MARISTGPGSRQTYATPWNLYQAIQKHFRLTFDLAAHAQNAKDARFYGPGSPISEDAFLQPWPLPEGFIDWLFLNPPYSDIEPWYQRCAEESRRGCKIVSLVPMDAANWFTRFVPGHAGIWHLKGRVKFDGAEQSGAKDSCLHIWHPHYVGSYRIWDWKNDRFII